MSVNYYDKINKQLITLSAGSRMWVGTESAYNTAVSLHTISNNCLVCIIKDNQIKLLYRDPNGVEKENVALPDWFYKRMDDDEQDILALMVAVTILQQAQVDGTADNIAVETFETQSGFTILSGHYDSTNHMLYA